MIHASVCNFVVAAACLCLASYAPAQAMQLDQISHLAPEKINPVREDAAELMQVAEARDATHVSLAGRTVAQQIEEVAPVAPLLFVNLPDSLRKVSFLFANLAHRVVPELRRAPIVNALLQDVDLGLQPGAEPGGRQQGYGPGPAGGQQPMSPTEMQDLMRKNMFYGFFSALCFAGLVTVVAIFYNNEKKFPPVAEEGSDHSIEDGFFKYSLFSCCDDAKFCCFGTCCAPIRWADTMRMMGFMPFFTALAVYLGLCVLDTVVFACAGLVLLGVQTYYRQKIRGKFSMPYVGTCGSIFQDCCTYMFCSCCAIIQEARQVEEAHRAKHPVVADAV